MIRAVRKFRLVAVGLAVAFVAAATAAVVGQGSVGCDE